MIRYPMVVGLGNPGVRYENTRHNVGFMLLDRLAGDCGAVFESRPIWQAHLTKTQDGATLIKPQTFMNLSGRSVRQVMAFYGWAPAEVLVVYDDIALPLGRLRLREKGSAGGHNGIKSLIEHLATEDFPRLKIGIGGAEGEQNLSDHVLGKFAEEEQGLLQNTLANAVSAIQLARSQGIAIAANQYNSRIEAPKITDHEQEIRRSDRS